ncbi:hypothetical protein DVB69_04850 [Sporosarcina sp. BI001-red]|uniref:YybH family protein n=1 Tax=Sporosarcina sp. BI001-red TaxID=2282866 RepID=UPI000E26C3D4|nr:nuclear transport factor 2 family protein [Sporosarcina sp. BI001-red]REB10136.1 hypothetical protein DVB69_04850 [Sporosarcina sp. BI001-red]
MKVVFQTVHDVLENYKTAIFNKDVDQFLASFSSDIHMYDCWDDWEITGISVWEEIVKSWFNGLNDEGVFLKTDFKDVVVEENSALAFLHCAVTYAAHNKSGEKIRQMTNRFTFGLRKINNSWVITHAHSSLPIGSETGKGIFNLK